MLVLNLLFFIVSCFVLVQSSGLVIKALSKISTYFRVNEFAVGFIVVAVSTSLPELFVGVTSAFTGNTDLALGNVIGANILNLTLVIGIAVLLSKGIRIRSSVIKKDFIYMIAIIFLPLLLMWDQKLSRFDGIVLIIVFIFYIWQMVRQEHRFKKNFDFVEKRELRKHILYAIIGLVILLASANYVVLFAGKLSTDMGLPQLLIGLIILSLGTSLPELIIDAKAVLAKHQEIAVGDTIGSVVTNSTLVLGVTALIHPIQTDFFFFFTSALFLVIISFIFLTFAESEKGINWKEGLSLIMLYVFFIIIQTYITMLRSSPVPA
jgi:cation:H+ antiporter